MKARTFLIALSVTIGLLLIISFGIWRGAAAQSPLNLKNEPITLPSTAKFFPKEALLTIHLKLDVNRFPRYIEAVVPEKKRNKARSETVKIRNGFFALAGLDFERDLSSWVNPKFSLSIIKVNGEQEHFGWLLAIQGDDKEGPSSFMKSFWDKKVLDGEDVLQENYNNFEIYSYNDPLFPKKRKEISTTIVEDKVVLASSEKVILKKAIDTSKDPQLSQLNDQELIQSIEKMNTGIGLINASEEALETLLDLPKSLTQKNSLERLVASIKAEGPELLLDGLFKFKESGTEIKSQRESAISLVNGSGGPIQDIAILSEPFKLIDSASEDPEAKLLGPILRQYINDLDSTAINRITNSEKGPLVWINEDAGWIIGTKDNSQDLEIDKSLRSNGFSKSSLALKEKKIDVWSKLAINKSGKYDNIINNVEIILSQENESNWWGNNIAALEQRLQVNSLTNNNKRFQNLISNDGNYFDQQVFLGPTSSQKILSDWKPWKLLQAVIGHSLKQNIKSIAISIGASKDDIEQTINFHAKLLLG
ncbi:DUF3352 domain-containing protein [Prochlorococcus marinus]|uniref:DUF3352 domain-containing protein n=1 Tax=Prochlorococcus marinus (strain MIT 9211) TaxID=93059 RepID=A9BD22_PROM4|nr:DUF3352 domain-containing protein [Prochlorococcus marinus]ABX08110.1 Hypothetical protein P9211_01791 [Prochlorococcus marinus str. MIT 9211]